MICFTIWDVPSDLHLSLNFGRWCLSQATHSPSSTPFQTKTRASSLLYYLPDTGKALAEMKVASQRRNGPVSVPRARERTGRESKPANQATKKVKTRRPDTFYWDIPPVKEVGTRRPRRPQAFGSTGFLEPVSCMAFVLLRGLALQRWRRTLASHRPSSFPAWRDEELKKFAPRPAVTILCWPQKPA